MRGLDLFKEMSKEELQQLWSETMGDEPFPILQEMVLVLEGGHSLFPMKEVREFILKYHKKQIE